MFGEYSLQGYEVPLRYTVFEGTGCRYCCKLGGFAVHVVLAVRQAEVTVEIS